MTVVTSLPNTATIDTSAVPLAKYAQIIRYDENAFFGINHADNRERSCRKIWTKLERDMVSRYLRDAQTMIEGILGYPLKQQWFVNEQHRNASQIFTKWSYVQALGNRATTVIEASVALDFTADPATFTSSAVHSATSDEVHLYIAGTSIELFPSALTVGSGSGVSGTIPWARLVKEEYQNNPQEGLFYDYVIGGQYVEEIDIVRVYTDTTNPGLFVWPLGEYCPKCGEDTRNACGYLHSSISGAITMLPTDTTVCSYCGNTAAYLRLNYCAGKSIDIAGEEAIVRLAHALMPIEPCPGCDPLRMLWQQDRSIPNAITADRANCAFGVYDGAWRAWQYAHRNKHVRLSYI